MTKKLLSIIALSLCLSLLLSIPVQALSEIVNNSESDFATSSFDDVEGNDYQIGSIVTENKAARTENTKEFLLDDGTTMIAEYIQPIHYQNDDGEWIEYDNRLTANDTVDTNGDTKTANEEFTNNSSNLDITLSANANQDSMFNISSGKYSISWGYNNTNDSDIYIADENIENSGSESFTTLTNSTSEAEYKDIYDNIDLHCCINSTGIKENIILKSPDVQNEFFISYLIENLTVEQIDDYTIILYDDDNNEVYRIMAPYMLDNDGNTSTQLKLEQISCENGVLNIKLVADYWFIHSIGRSFPIIIDPEVTNKLTTRTSSSISFYENSNNSVLSYGPYYNSNNSYLIAAMNSLPELSQGDKIVSAKFNFEIINSESLFTNEDDDPIIINSHKLISASDGSTEYETAISDYDSLTYADNKYVSFDLTKLFNEWYDNGEDVDGFILESFDTIGSNNIRFVDSGNSYSTPSLTIVYKNYVGTEPNLTYNTIAVGEKAESSVSYYSGSLNIKQPIYSGSGSRMPISITATYNSVLNNKLFANGSPAGYGWQFSFNQYIQETNDVLKSAGYDYIYTDEDGTEHYFKRDDSSSEEEWLDSDNLGLTLTTDEDYIYITNGSTTQKYEPPENNGILLSETDSNNNSISYSYNSLGNLTKITDGSGREIHINYTYYSGNSEPRVYSFDLPDNSTIQLSYYTNQLLASVTFPNNKSSWFYYTEYTPNGLLNKVEQRDYVDSTYVRGLKHSYSYNNKHQVTYIKEYGSNNTLGNYLNLSYNNDNTTTVTDRKGRSETYTFNNDGETAYILNSSGYISSGSNGLFISNGSDSFTKNFISESTEQSAIGNYYSLLNGDKDGVTSAGGTASIDNSEYTDENGQVQYFGSTSIKISNPITSSNSAFFTGVTHQFNASEFNSNSVTFSAYIKTKNIQQIYSGGPVGAMLKIKCFDSSGDTISEENSIGIDGTQEWQRLSVSTDISESTSYFKIYLMLRYASGTAWFDCIQLEEGDCANDFNALQNSNFEGNEHWYTEENHSIYSQDGSVAIAGSAGVYNNAPIVEDNESTDETDTETQLTTYSEAVTETLPSDIITTYDDYGNVIKSEQGFVTRTVKKTYEASTNHTDSDIASTGSSNDTTADNPLGNKYVYQDVTVGRAGVSFNVSGEAQADSVPLSNETRTFGIALNIYYLGNTTPETHYQEFNPYTSHKQTVSMNVDPDNSESVIDYVSLAFVYGNNQNTMTVYNAMLNINCYGVSTVVEESEESSTSSSDEDNLINYEVLSESIDKSKDYIQTSSEYDSTGNYVTKEIDGSGNSVIYTYDSNGNATSVTDGVGNVKNYTYNSGNNITRVSNGNSENQYSYNNADEISAISHNDFSYTFNYNVYNNLISAKIGNVALVSNTYSANNGNLTRSTYANGDFIDYTYDDYDNIIKIASENGTIAEFIYNKKGLVAKSIDNSSETTTYYYYDFNGNLIGEYRQNENGSLSYYLGYNSDGNQFEKSSINGEVKTITTETNSNGDIIISNDGVTTNSSIDDFGRTTEVSTNSSSGSQVFSTAYEYMSGNSDNSTTNVISKVTHTYGDNSLISFEYTYDANGNITQVKQDDSISNTYVYDNLNQLSEEYDYLNNFYVEYSYDNSGNILSKKQQSLDSDGSPTGSANEVVYNYNDSVWKDKVTKIGNDTIAYDESGNPVSYRNGMSISWENGRQLSSLQTDSYELYYKYNSAGLRTQKIDEDNGTTNYYYDSNNNLIGLTKGTTTLLFYYDSNNNVTSFRYNGNMYYYIKNLQGDIVEIIDQTGAVQASYVYDAWGKILSSTGNATIKTINPLRYRGYVYDDETGLYYLQSRYYDPVTGRFLNADSIFDTQSGSTLSTNMFAYCENNAVNRVDSNGFWAERYGFEKTRYGFNVNPNIRFLSRTFCMLFAADFLWRYGVWRWYGKVYSGMNCTRIAQELWVHAVAFYLGSAFKTALSKRGLSSTLVNRIVKSATLIEVNSNDSRAFLFSTLWMWGKYIKTTILTTVPFYHLSLVLAIIL